MNTDPATNPGHSYFSFSVTISNVAHSILSMSPVPQELRVPGVQLKDNTHERMQHCTIYSPSDSLFSTSTSVDGEDRDEDELSWAWPLHLPYGIRCLFFFAELSAGPIIWKWDAPLLNRLCIPWHILDTQCAVARQTHRDMGIEMCRGQMVLMKQMSAVALEFPSDKTLHCRLHY